MKTMEKLCKRFERLHPGYEASLDTCESYPGFYRVYIDNAETGSLCHVYTFRTCADFRDWTDGVVLDG